MIVEQNTFCRAPVKTLKTRIPRHRHPRDEIARVGRKDVVVSGYSVSMSVSWNADLMHAEQL